MMIVFLFLKLWILRCTVSSSSPPPRPINVTFSSLNLRNTLQWIPGSGTSSDAQFTVQYAIYGESVVDSRGRRGLWRPVQQCTDISRYRCDLSSETWDLEKRYYARVRAISMGASSEWTLTERFEPKEETNFGPPLVLVEIDDNGAVITLTGPMRYPPNHRTPMISMATLYPQMMYNLSIHNKGRDKMYHFTVMSSQYKYRLLEYDTEYCFSAKTKFLSMTNQCQSSQWQCITTPADPATGQQQWLIVGMVVSVVFICMLVLICYLLCHYLMGKGQRGPHTLNLPSFIQPRLIFPLEQTNLILITVAKPADMDKGLSDPASPPCDADTLAGSVPRRSDLPPQPEDHVDDVPVEYGFLSVAHRAEQSAKVHEPEVHKYVNDVKHPKILTGSSLQMKEQKVEGGHSVGVYAPQKPLQTQQAHVGSLGHFQSMSKQDMREKESRVCPGSFINTFPQLGVFNVSLDPQAECREGIRGEEDKKVRLTADGGVVERSKTEGIPLLSNYIPQNINILAPYADESDFLPDDYGILRLSTRIERERDEEEEEESLLVDWEPINKLISPELMMDFTQGVRETWLGEEVSAKMGKLLLEDVFVRQTSEEEE